MARSEGEGIDIDGLKELLSALRKIDPELKLEVKTINRDAARPVFQQALQLVPVRSGRLQRSIRILASQRAGRVAAGKKLVPYAGPIHFGWPARHIAPNLFLFKALDRRRLQVLQVWEKGIDRVIEKAMRRTK